MSAAWRRALMGLAVLHALASVILVSVLLIPPAGLGPVEGVHNADVRELPGGDEEPWTIGVISDIQNGHAYLPELFHRLSSARPRAIIVTGDLAPDPSPELAQLPVWQLRRCPPPAPMFVVPGNHDIGSEAIRPGEREFVTWYGALTFELRIGRTVFLGLDNSTSPIVGKALDAVRLRLEESKERGERTILCLHRNIIKFEEQDPLSRAGEALRELIRNYEIPYVLCGHLHHDGFDAQGKTRYVAVPASGHRPANEPGQKPIAYMLLHWNGSSFELRREEFYRRNVTELKGVVLYLALAKIHPLCARFPLASSAALGACVAVGVFCTGVLCRCRKAR